MAFSSLHDTPRWFVLNHFGMLSQEMARKSISRFNSGQGCDLELFAPTYVIKEIKNGEVRMRTVNLTFHYVFVRGTLPKIKEFCQQHNNFSLLIDRVSSERYAIIPDREMMSFKNIAKTYKNCLPYFSLNDIDLEAGDLVEIINGDFPGLVGIYMPRPKSNSGNILLHIYNKVGTMVFDVKATDVRVLEFSSKTTRANDQIDAFIPHLFKALRLYHNKSELPISLAAKLSVFCSRMAVVHLNNRKLDAKLQALLFAGNLVIGNLADAAEAKTRYERVMDDVTNEWTAAMIRLIFAVVANNSESLHCLNAEIKKLNPTSRSQLMLAEECSYYNSGI